MSNISSVLGTAGGVRGTGVSGPELANIQTPTTDQQAQQAYDEAQNTLAQQRGFVNATQPGGTAALQSQQDLLAQLGQQAQGVGPNPALAQLAQTTGQNISQQGALQAGQRGSSQNTGLIARNVAQQGGQLQQQAAGQAATMAAQQQLAARQQLAQQQQAMVGQQANAVQNYSQAGQNEQSNILNAVNAQNQAAVGNQAGMNAANTNLIGQTAAQQESFRLGSSSGAGSAMSAAEGGVVPKMAGGGYAPVNQPPPTQGPMSAMGQWLKGAKGGPQGGGSSGGAMGLIAKGAQAAYNYLSSPTAENSATDRTDEQTQEDYSNADAALQTPGPSTEEDMPADNSDMTGADDMAFAAEGGKVPAMVSPGEQYLKPKDVKKVAKGANPLSVGERIPGKPKFKGNNYANDVVPKTLESGGIVIPNKVMQSKNPHFEAMKFVHAHIAKNRGRK